jgi:hypothetical protein
MKTDSMAFADWADQGIVGRGVLLDWPRWLQDNSKEVPSPVLTHRKMSSIRM